MKWVIFAIFLFVFISGCITQDICGDGICSGNETPETCSHDCEQPEEINDYLLMIKKDCELAFEFNEGEIVSEYEGNKFIYAIAETTETRSDLFKEDDCMLAVLTPKEAREMYDNLSPELKKIARGIVRNLDLRRTVDNDDIPEEPPDLINRHQKFITPDDSAVQEIARRVKGNKQAYREAVRWMWVSEKTLNNAVEKWLKPNEFLVDTPTYPTNPVPGRIASDCEEQANTLVSLLRAEGVPPDKVRIVLGTVDFDGEIGGHAWVEVYEDGVWFALEATSGPYWNDDKEEFIPSNGLSYGYYKFFEYPSVEIWSYYNDYYYYNPRNGQGNPPALWLE